MRKPFAISFGLATLILALVGCPPNPFVWYRVLGENGDDIGFAVTTTFDGGYVIAGSTEPRHKQDDDVSLLKLDGFGAVQWTTSFGGEANDVARDVAQTSDGGFVLAGRFGDNLDEKSDAFLLKVDRKGAEEWRRILDSDGAAEALSVEECGDGGFLVALAEDLFRSPNAVMVKTDARGRETWRTTSAKFLFSVGAVETVDGGFALAAWGIVDDDSQGFAGSAGKVVVIKTNSSGHEEWTSTTPVEDAAAIGSIAASPDGGVALAGQEGFLRPSADTLLWLLDKDGRVTVQNKFPARGRNEVESIEPTHDGGYIVAGKVSGIPTPDNMLALRIDAKGELIWSREYGDENFDRAHAAIESKDGGFLVVGESDSFNEEDLTHHSEILVFKTGPLGHEFQLEIDDEVPIDSELLEKG